MDLHPGLPVRQKSGPGAVRFRKVPFYRNGRPCKEALWALLVGLTLTASACSVSVTTNAGQTTTSSTSQTSTTSHKSTSTTTKAHSSIWSAPTNISGGSALNAVECPSSRDCVALGVRGLAFHLSAATWSGATETGAANGATGAATLSCVGPTFCVGVWRGTSQAVAWNGQTWSAPMTISGSQALQAVGCASPTFCVAVDGLGDGFYFNGSGWSSQPNDWGSVESISCPTSSFCISVAGGVSMWNGSSWTEPQVFGTTSDLTSVSCPTTTFCAAVDSTGDAIHWDGAKWSAPQRVESSSAEFGGPSVTGVSCSSADFCVAVDSAGMAFVWNGSRWSAPEAADPGHSLERDFLRRTCILRCRRQTGLRSHSQVGPATQKSDRGTEGHRKL